MDYESETDPVADLRRCRKGSLTWAFESQRVPLRPACHDGSRGLSADPCGSGAGRASSPSGFPVFIEASLPHLPLLFIELSESNDHRCPRNRAVIRVILVRAQRAVDGLYGRLCVGLCSLDEDLDVPNLPVIVVAHADDGTRSSDLVTLLISRLREWRRGSAVHSRGRQLAARGLVINTQRQAFRTVRPMGPDSLCEKGT